MRNVLLFIGFTISATVFGQNAELTLSSGSSSDQVKCVSLKDIKTAADNEDKQISLSFPDKNNIKMKIGESDVESSRKNGTVSWDITSYLGPKRKGEEILATISWDDNGPKTWVVKVKVDKDCKCDVSEKLTCSSGVKMIELDVCHNDCNDWTYKCGTGCSSNKMTVRQNELSAMRLVNVNPLRYEYSVNGSELSLHQEGAQQFEDLLSSTFNKNKEGKNNADEPGSPKGADSTAELPQLVPDTNLPPDPAKQIYNFIHKAKKLKADVDSDMASLKSRSCLSNDEVTEKREVLLAKFKELPDAAMMNVLFETVSSTAKDSLKEGIKSFKSDYTHIKDELVKFYSIKFEVTSLPYQVKAKNIDAITYEISRKDLNSNTTVETSYNVFVRGGVKLDFSAGVFVTGLRDRSYATNDTTVQQITGSDTSSVTMRRFINREKLPMDFSVATMFNVTSRFGETVNIGMSTGLGVSVQGNFQMMFGGHIVFGKFQRFALHGGLALGWYSDLESGYEAWDAEDADTYSNMYNLGDSNTPPMAKRFGYSWFAGISYNITKAKTEKPEED